MKNREIRSKANSAGVKLWQIADALGMADTTFSRKLRKEMDAETKARIFAVIDELAKEV